VYYALDAGAPPPDPVLIGPVFPCGCVTLPPELVFVDGSLGFDWETAADTVDKTKADSPLVVDGNRMLPCPLSLERVKPVAWRGLEIIKPSRQVDVLQLPSCSLDHIRRKPSRLASRVQPLRVPIRERLDHAVSVLCHVTRVKVRDLPRSP